MNQLVDRATVTDTLIVVDVDGTLVDNAGVTYPGLDRLLELSASPGYGMALASARPPWNLQRMARELGPSVTDISAFQGAMVQTRSPDGWREVCSITIAPDVVRRLNDVVDPTLARWWYTAGSWTISREDDAAREEARIVGVPWSAVGSQPPVQPVLKLLAVGQPDRVAIAAPHMPGVRSAVSKPAYLEVVSSDVAPDKGIHLVRAMRPEVARLVAVGDGLNDIGMLRAADQSFTFADASPEVLSAATSVLPADRTRAYRELVALLKAGPENLPAASAREGR